MDSLDAAMTEEETSPEDKKSPVQNAEVQNAEVPNAEVQNAQVQNAEVPNAEVQNAKAQNAQVQNEERPLQNAEVLLGTVDACGNTEPPKLQVTAGGPENQGVPRGPTLSTSCKVDEALVKAVVEATSSKDIQHKDRKMLYAAMGRAA